MVKPIIFQIFTHSEPQIFTQVNLFNAVYLMFFLVFIVSPRRAAWYWGSLVVYCEFVILCIYVYYFTILKGTVPCMLTAMLLYLCLAG